MSWQLKGEYFENCSCDVLCPCIASALQAPATQDRCLVPLFIHIEEGNLDEARLDGLTFVMVLDTPARMADGDWRVGLYLDERATEGQREALLTILSGDHGGMPEMLKPFIGEMLGVKVVPIHYSGEGQRRRAEIPGIAEFELENIDLLGNGEPFTIKNVFHPMASELPVAKGIVGRFDDPDFSLSFDNAGKNGHISPFVWQG
ncbi:MAG: DUF1326 domain-containing protein [Gaiellales bacterium]